MTARKRNTDADPIESMLEEWKRGMLTFWALSLVCLRPMYGLEIKNEIESSSQGKIRLGASTIYQLLRRLETRQLAVSHWESTTQGPPRAYYEPTRAGRTLVWRYANEILSPSSPIPAALGLLMARLYEQFSNNQTQEEQP